MNQIRFVLLTLLCIVLINIYEIFVNKVYRKSSVNECLIIILCLVNIYLHEIDYIDLACLNGNAMDFVLIIVVGIASLVSIILTLQKGNTKH